MTVERTVIIVGGGFSGTMAAVELARRGLSATIIDPGREGRGTAFSTPEDAHLLNVPAGRMGAFADHPGDFARAVAREGHEAGDFVSRRRFGDYLKAILDQAVAGGRVAVVKGEAVAASRQGNGWRVTLADGSLIDGAALVLAQGNQPPQPLPLARGLPTDLYVNDPWSEAGRKAIVKGATSGGDVLIVGTGLTMVDVVLSLDEARLRGRIVALSRRGLMPRAHADHVAAPVEITELPKGSLRRLWHWVQDRGASVGWRAAVDSLRPHSHAIWQALGEADQRRFLRHARPWWDVHRHRIAPEVSGRIKRLMQLGQLEIQAGRLTDLWADGKQLGAAIRPRGQRHPADHRFALVINATGPLGSISASPDPLVRSLIEAGLARPDPLDIGFDVDQGSRIVGPDGASAARAWALGPMTKGKFWEITAVPDIRGQVARVADEIAKELGG